MNKKWFVSMLSAGALALSSSAFAQSSATQGFYVGAEVGNTDVGASEDDVGIKIIGGFRFHPNIAVEAGYGMLYDKATVDVSTIEVVALGMFPVANQLSIIGKLGLANVDVEVPGGSDDKTELTWGLGVQYDVTPKLGVRALWQRYETEEAVDFLGVGVTWRF